MGDERNELEIDVEIVTGNERLAVRLVDHKAVDGSREGKGIEPNGPNGDLAIEQRRQLFNRDDANDRGQHEEPQDGIAEQDAEKPSGFASSRQVPLELSDQHHSLDFEKIRKKQRP